MSFTKNVILITVLTLFLWIPAFAGITYISQLMKIKIHPVSFLQSVIKPYKYCYLVMTIAHPLHASAFYSILITTL